MKILELLAPYIKGRVLLLGSEPERLSNPEWLLDRTKEYEARTNNDGVALKFIMDRCERLDREEDGDCLFAHSKTAYDLVIDAGWLEHRWYMMNALEAASDAVAKRGVVFHLSPLSMVNWGYYNLCPKLFEEFYKDWEVLEKWAVKKEHMVPLPMDRSSIASEVSMIWVARK